MKPCRLRPSLLLPPFLLGQVKEEENEKKKMKSSESEGGGRDGKKGEGVKRRWLVWGWLEGVGAVVPGDHITGRVEGVAEVALTVGAAK
jgi:hypothetical protein